MKRHPDWNISIPEAAEGRIYSTSETDTLCVTRSRYTPSKLSLARGNNRRAIMQIQLEITPCFREGQENWELPKPRERQDPNSSPKCLCLFVWLWSKAGWHAAIQIKVSKGECIKKLSGCLLLEPTMKVFCQSTNYLCAFQLPNISNVFALHQPDTSKIYYFVMKFSNQISQQSLHLAPRLIYYLYSPSYLSECVCLLHIS